MKAVFHRIVAVWLSVIVLVSTTSWKVEKHYCMGHLVDLAFFTNAEGCGMELETSDFSKMTCCDDQTVIISADDDLTVLGDDSDSDFRAKIAINATKELPILHIPETRDLVYKLHPPPLLLQDLYLLYEVFLI